MAEKQKTIKSPVSVSGVGLHTGDQVTLTFNPAPENFGYKFKRIDLEGQPIVEANVDYVVDTSRGTSIEQNGVRVQTIEHVLAALAGLEIDNALIEINSSETPIMDGSSKFYVEALSRIGLVEQDAERKYITIDSKITFTDPKNKVEIIAIPDNAFKISVMIDYESQVLNTQNAILKTITAFKDEFAPCRTFVFLHELEYLINNNLIKGGDLSNAIVFVDRIISQQELDRLATFFNKPKVDVLREGILNNVELSFPNEPARHKLLDLVGDLATLGLPIKGHIIANRPGHASNIAFAKLIKQQIKIKSINMKKQNASGGAPVFDPSAKPLYDINGIKKILPHRQPFLFVDKILEMSDKHIIGLKNVTINESFFVGHFPNEPVMPGVLQLEAMAQTGGVLVLTSVPNPQDYLPYFLKIDNVRFKQKVVPGDTLIFKLELIEPIRRGICHMKAEAYVGDKLVTEAELMAQIIKK